MRRGKTTVLLAMIAFLGCGALAATANSSGVVPREQRDRS
jgi:hypothetical protein